MIAEKRNASEIQIRLKTEYEAALVLYRKGDFILAEKKFASLYDSDNDLASNTMSERCRDYIDSPPDNWSGIVVMTEK